MKPDIPPPQTRDPSRPRSDAVIPPHLQKLSLPHLKNIIAVGSGKGGVGKSTVAANIAAALAQTGLSVGLLDADIYGPSQSRMMGLTGQRAHAVDKKLQPLSAHGMKIISMGMLAGESAPMIWRGPMIQTAFTQMLQDVEWGETDVIMIDLPPGTGDVQLSMTQKLDLAGAIIVSTPQDIALIDAKKAAAMFAKMNAPILGLIENMSFYCCPNCNHRDEIFSSGGAREFAKASGIPFLGALPLERQIADSSERGAPIVIGQPDSAAAQVFQEIAAGIAGGIRTARGAA
ncbi:MAG TPA: Mrp/NBP35 family ATP-binding protein [Alphaproteobacteria bacterium]|nr:Mrp/NBP35 family ATP-binding protein [Alphaproteobacteria bacterium]